MNKYKINGNKINENENKNLKLDTSRPDNINNNVNDKTKKSRWKNMKDWVKNNKIIAVGVAITVLVIITVIIFVVNETKKKKERLKTQQAQKKENYLPKRERTDPQSDWVLSNHLNAILNKQNQNIQKMNIKSNSVW